MSNGLNGIVGRELYSNIATQDIQVLLPKVGMMQNGLFREEKRKNSLKTSNLVEQMLDIVGEKNFFEIQDYGIPIQTGK